MGARQFKNYKRVLVDDEDGEFYAAAVKLLNKLYKMTAGRALLDAIESAPSGKGVGITGFSAFWRGKLPNRCSAGAEPKYCRLRQALRGAEAASIRDEVLHAVTLAQGNAGVSKDMLATQLAQLSPATVVARKNVGPAPTTRYQQNKDFALARSLIPDPEARLTTLGPAAAARLSLDAVLDGTAVPAQGAGGEYGFGDALVRVLRPWLEEGEGSKSKIEFDPAIETSCVGDGRMEKRPPEVGLAHELIHAWRNAVGMRLFDDFTSCGFPDDEIMTVGIPPYTYELFTENKFRAELGMPLRLGYR